MLEDLVEELQGPNHRLGSDEATRRVKKIITDMHDITGEFRLHSKLSLMLQSIGHC